MAIRFNKRKNKFLALLMAMMMTSSFAALAACNGGSNDDSSDDTPSTTPTQTDTSRINNGSFEFVDWDDGRNLLITSPTGWTKSTHSAASGSAVSSKSASGILNTDDEAWKNFTQSSLPEGVSAPKTADEAREYWSQMSAYDKLQFYKAWDDADYDEKVSKQDFYDAEKDNFNVNIKDVPVDKDGEIIQNPGTHTQDGEDKDTNVLMIHNAYTDGQGTAQKFTSSSTITLESGTSAKVSLWVKTSNLTYFSSGTDKQEDVVADKGAYIGITHTVGAKTLDQMQVKNINTEKMANTDNGWVQYTFYLQGCSFATSTFTMVLGLGQSGGTNRLEYVEGYAFFDDVECTIISNSEYDSVVEDPNATSTIPEITLATPADEKIFHADKAYINQREYALNLTHGDANFTSYTLPTMNVGLTEEKKGSYTYVAADDGKLNDPAKPGYDSTKPIRLMERNLNFDISNDAAGTGVFTTAQLLAKMAATATDTNDYVKSVLTKGFGYEYDEQNQTSSLTKFPFADNTQTLLLLSAGGANYTAKGMEFTLNAGKQMVLSFFVKTSNMEGITGANVSVRHNGGILSSISTIDTTNITTIDVDGDDGKDIYKGWQQCFLFVENPTETDGLKFSVEFSYGGATVYGASKDSFVDGWAAFTAFEIVADMGGAYEYANSATYSKVLSLSDPNGAQYSSSAFDTPAYLTGQEAIETGYADPRNYIGVKGGSGYVKNDPTADRSKYSSDTAGLISKKYIENYAGSGSIMGITDQAKLNALLGNATQPLLIYNKEESAYGFISINPDTVSDYREISVRVKVSAGAVANVYLIDMDDDSRENTLSIGRRISYWYDKDGNVCKVDPTSEDFIKKTDVVLELQSNGLYTAKGIEGYYANLQAYPQYVADATERLTNGKDLLVAEGGVEYAYTNAWNGVGLDGVAFYYANGKYYADPAKTVEVKDFSEVDGLTPRYTAVADKDLMVSVGNTNGEWKTITFYLGADSDTEKNFRLEVWSGSRDGETKNPAGSYVMFDTCNAATLDEATFGSLAQDAFDYLLTLTDDQGNLLYADEDALKEALKANGNLTYNAYSFYDDAKFLRYDGSLDENKVGNKYDDYDSTSEEYAETLSYLYYENADYNLIKVFANFTQNEKNVPVDVDPEEDETPSTPDEEVEPDETNWGLLISSLAVAGVLVAVLVIIGVRKTVKWSKKKAAERSRPRRKFAKAKKPEAKNSDTEAND
ncbi:MAG: hypothetical protein IJF39_03260 [Clostridia bacterium]|nr:hypothetical protein [Clostridia bacterium]